MIKIDCNTLKYNTTTEYIYMNKNLIKKLVDKRREGVLIHTINKNYNYWSIDDINILYFGCISNSLETVCIYMLNKFNEKNFIKKYDLKHCVKYNYDMSTLRHRLYNENIFYLKYDTYRLFKHYVINNIEYFMPYDMDEYDYESILLVTSEFITKYMLSGTMIKLYPNVNMDEYDDNDRRPKLIDDYAGIVSCAVDNDIQTVKYLLSDEIVNIFNIDPCIGIVEALIFIESHYNAFTNEIFAFLTSDYVIHRHKGIFDIIASKPYREIASIESIFDRIEHITY